MKYWHELELDNFDLIKEKTLSMLDKTNLIERGLFWNDIKLLDVIRHVPELPIALREHGLRAVQISLIVIKKERNEEVHIDDIEKHNTKARLQIPILNTEGSFTKFYIAPPEAFVLQHTPNNVPYWNCDPTLCSEVDSVELKKPTVLRISEPHSVRCTSNTYPRIALTIRLNKDPVFLLDI